jgi:hypothetical protein
MTADRTRQGCPSLERIAQLLDGTVEGREKDRLLEHVGTCEPCYELFAGSARFLADGAAAVAPSPSGEVLVHPRARSTGRERRWAVAGALAAALALTVLYGSPWADHLRPEPGPRRFAAALAVRPDPAWAADHGWSQVRGGAPVPAEAAGAFRLGALLVDFETYRSLGEPSSAAVFLPEASRLVADFEVVGPTLQSLLEELAAGLEAADASALAEGARAAELVVSAVPDAVMPFLRLGAWCEAGRLAAGGGDRRYFERTLARRPPVTPGTRQELPPSLSVPLAELEGSLADLVAGQQWRPLAQRFAAIVEAGGSR